MTPIIPQDMKMSPLYDSFSQFYLFESFASECQLDTDNEIRHVVKSISEYLGAFEKILCTLESQKSIGMEDAKKYFICLGKAYNGYGAWMLKIVKMNTLRMEVCKLGNFDLNLRKPIQDKLFESQMEFVKFHGYVKMSEYNRRLNKEGLYMLTRDFHTTCCYTEVYGYFILPKVKMVYELCCDKRYQIEYLKGHRFPFIGKDYVGDERVENHWIQMRNEFEQGNVFHLSCLFMEIHWNFTWASSNADNHKLWYEFINSDYYSEQIIQKKWTNESLELVILEIMTFLSREDTTSIFEEKWKYLRFQDAFTFNERIFAYLRFAYETILLLASNRFNKIFRRNQVQSLTQDYYVSYIRGYYAQNFNTIPSSSQWLLQSMLGVPHETLNLLVQNHIPTLKRHVSTMIYDFMEICDAYDDVPELLYLEYDKLQELWCQTTIFQKMCIHFVTMRQHMCLTDFKIAKEEVTDILLQLLKRGEGSEISNAFFGIASKFIKDSLELEQYDKNIKTRLDPNDAVYLLVQDRLKMSWMKGESLETVCGVERLEKLFISCGQTFRKLVVLNVTLHGQVYNFLCQKFAHQVLVGE